MPQTSTELATIADRRDAHQARDRQSGMLVFIAGARAKVVLKVPATPSADNAYWAVGELITIYGPKSRVIGLVQDMCSSDQNWRPGEENLVYATMELLGEVVDVEGGKPTFRRGIAHYPPLGTLVHRIRSADIAAIYDLGDRKATSIGVLSQAQHMAASIDIAAMLNKHFAVVGTTGVGKSSAVSYLVRKALLERPKLRTVVLDPHNEYAHAFRGKAKTISAHALELPYWLFQFEEFVDAIYHGATPPAEEADILREALQVARDEYGQGPADRSGGLLKKAYRSAADASSLNDTKPYRFNDLIAAVDVEIGRHELRFSRSALRALKSRLESVSNDYGYRFMFGKSSTDGQVDLVTRSLFRLHDHEHPVTVLQLAGIPSEVVNAAVSVLARMAFDLAAAHQARYEILLVCEEAHRYVPSDSSLGFAPVRRAISRIAKEGRKYGCYIGVVTQRPSELDATILSQCSTLFTMRLSNALDQEIVRKANPDNSAGVLDFISSLANRECIAFGEAVSTPMRMLFEYQTPETLPKMSLGDEADSTDLLDRDIHKPAPVEEPPMRRASDARPPRLDTSALSSDISAPGLGGSFGSAPSQTLGGRRALDMPIEPASGRGTRPLFEAAPRNRW